MLRDIERKVLRILWNFLSSRRRMPSLKELSMKTGKHENEIKFIIGKLKEAVSLIGMVNTRIAYGSYAAGRMNR